MKRALLAILLAACGGSESATTSDGDEGGSTGPCPAGFYGPSWPTVECRECALPRLNEGCATANDAWITECQAACDACGEDAVCFAVYDDSEDECVATYPASCLSAHTALEDCYRAALEACGA